MTEIHFTIDSNLLILLVSLAAILPFAFVFVGEQADKDARSPWLDLYILTAVVALLGALAFVVSFFLIFLQGLGVDV